MSLIEVKFWIEVGGCDDCERELTRYKLCEKHLQDLETIVQLEEDPNPEQDPF